MGRWRSRAAQITVWISLVLGAAAATGRYSDARAVGFLVAFLLVILTALSLSVHSWLRPSTDTSAKLRKRDLDRVVICLILLGLVLLRWFYPLPR